MQVRHGQKILLWSLFFLVCMGLGYPTLNRYNPQTVPGLYDSVGYASLVTGANQAGDEAHRVLVPYLAKPIYWLAKGHLHTWDPVFFALLVVNSFFIATTAYLLVDISDRIVGNYAVALLSGFLYLTNFAVANFNLSGYVDSAINCMMVAVAWALLTDRWWLLPICGVLGALAKETFVPLSAVFAFAWWLTSWRRSAHRLSRLAWVGAMVAVGFAVLIFVMSRVTPGATPITFAVSRWEGTGAAYFYLSGLVGCLFARETFYVFGWLLPLGVWRLGRLPKPWVAASVCAALAALAMGAYDDALGNTVRPLFSAIGPLLSLSASILLVEIGAGARNMDTGDTDIGLNENDLEPKN
ncbi:MAG: hypothetical protein WCF30_09555 [Terracidiphilus sp.]